MKRMFVAVFVFIAVIPIVMAQVQRPRPSEFAHTFSIVARDPQTGEIGVAVQSHWFSVGKEVTWVEAGVGAVATQAMVQQSYGRDGLELMRKGTSAPDALYQLLKADTARNMRQVAFVDAQGNTAVWTGSHCVDYAGDIAGGSTKRERKISGAADDGAIHVGQGYTVEANMMISDKIWPAMDKAFNETKGDLAVEHNDNKGALREYGAAEKLAQNMPGVDKSRVAEMSFWHAQALVQMGRVDEALPLFKKAFELHPQWVVMVPRVQKTGMLPNDQKVIDRILAQAPKGK